MSSRNLVLDNDAVMDAINDSDFGDDSDEDKNWVPPGEEPNSPPEEEQEEDVRAPVVAAPAARSTWTKRRFHGKPMPSVTSTVEEVLSPAEYFEKYFIYEVFEKFALYTNMYYQTTKNEVLKHPITAADIKKFFGVNGILGCVKYPRIKMAWLQRICDTIKAPRCCRLKSCSSRSKVRCTKCNVYLCNTKDNHCFYLFHNEK